MRSDIVPGAEFPDYELPDETGRRRRLSEIQAGNPLCVVVARGHWCPKDQRQHRLLVDMEPEVDVSYTGLVTISSTDSIFECLEWKQALGAHWPFLADQRRMVQKDLEITEYTDPHHEPAVPHTFVLEPGLVIYSIYNGYWFWGRPSQDDLRHDFRAVTQKVRSDWDITAPGMREKWDAGERDAFFPYKGGH